MLPIGMLVLGSIPWRPENAPLFVFIVVLGALVGSAMGLLMGTSVKANRINIVFSLVFTPLLFTGSSQYPWPSLDQMRWFQVVTALNPLTYVSEGLRAAMVPEVPHMPPAVGIAVLIVAIAGISWGGMVGFRRRALD
jgi:ABC-2 type transport system permease protein